MKMVSIQMINLKSFVQVNRENEKDTDFGFKSIMKTALSGLLVFQHSVSQIQPIHKFFLNNENLI